MTRERNKRLAESAARIAELEQKVEELEGKVAWLEAEASVRGWEQGDREAELRGRFATLYCELNARVPIRTLPIGLQLEFAWRGWLPQ